MDVINEKTSTKKGDVLNENQKHLLPLVGGLRARWPFRLRERPDLLEFEDSAGVDPGVDANHHPGRRFPFGPDA